MFMHVNLCLLGRFMFSGDLLSTRSWYDGRIQGKHYNISIFYESPGLIFFSPVVILENESLSGSKSAGRVSKTVDHVDIT